MTKKQKKLLCRIIVTAVLVLAIRLFSIGGLPGTLLYLAAYLIIGYDILRKAGKGILRGQVFDENFLMAVATVGAIGLAFYEKSGDFMEAVAVMLFYQIGELFQSYAVGKSRKNLGEVCEHRCSAPGAQEGYRFSKAMEKTGFIGTADIRERYLPLGFSNFKLEGRGLGSALVLEFLLYYLTRPEYQIHVREAIYLDNMLDLF